MNMNKKVYKKPTMIVAELNAFGCYMDEQGFNTVSNGVYSDVKMRISDGYDGSDGFGGSGDDIDW